MAQLTKGTAAGLLALSAALIWTISSPAQSKPPGRSVTLVEEPSAYTLSNGIVSARVNKNSGDLLSFRFNEIEMLATIMGPDGLPNTTTDKPGIKQAGRRRPLYRPPIWILVRDCGPRYDQEDHHRSEIE